MREVRLAAIGRATPAHRVTQHALRALNPWPDSPLVDRLFLESPVHSRGLFVPPDWYRAGRTLTDTNAAWKEGALALGGAALDDALAAAGRAPAEVDAFGVTTVTGYATPGLDLLLARDRGLRDDVFRAHFNCIGCHAAIPLLRVVHDHVRARPGSLGVALAVEICSACFADDPSPENLVALSLFGDGAAAAVLSDHGPGPAVVDFASAYDFEHMDALAFGLTASGFRIRLDPTIPDHIGARIAEVVDRLLGRRGLDRAAVSTWCFHPGGSRILDAVAARLDLDDAAMRPSRRVLRAHGNMSSPSVLFVLADALREAPPPPGTHGVLAAFGPGLGIEAALLRFDG